MAGKCLFGRDRQDRMLVGDDVRRLTYCRAKTAKETKNGRWKKRMGSNRPTA